MLGEMALQRNLNFTCGRPAVYFGQALNVVLERRGEPQQKRCSDGSGHLESRGSPEGEFTIRETACGDLQRRYIKLNQSWRPLKIIFFD
jgi:hypothetical protein